MAACEVYFVNVGQGTAQVVALGDHKALLVDLGPKVGRKVPKSSHRLMALLTQLRIKTIVLMVISHLHEDHFGAYADILSEFVVRQVYYYESGVEPGSEADKFLEFLQEQKERQPDFIYQKLPVDATILYENSNIKLDVLYPIDEQDRSQGERKKDENASAMIVRLTVDEQSLLFTSDAPYSAYKNFTPLNVDIITLPHHGGSFTKDVNEIETFYSQKIKSQFAICSFGTTNIHRHPHKQHLAIARQYCKDVFCTQLAGCCCPDPEARTIWRDKQKQLWDKFATNSALRSPYDPNANVANVPCADTVGFEIIDGELIINNYEYLKRMREWGLTQNLPLVCAQPSLN